MKRGEGRRRSLLMIHAPPSQKTKNKENKIGKDSLPTSGVPTSQVTMRASQTGHVTCVFFVSASRERKGAGGLAFEN